MKFVAITALRRFNPLLWITALLVVAIMAAGWYWIAQKGQIEDEFQVWRTSAPSRVYARPPVLYFGMDIKNAGLARHLERVGYRKVSGTSVASGEYTAGDFNWIIGVRPFVHGNGTEPGGKVIVHLDGDGRISGLNNEAGDRLKTVRIEPAEIGTFIPENGKDRIPVRLDEVPGHLVDAILITEDRRFFNHGGIDLYRIAGALIANLRNRRIVEGASTITQQLAKNLFLSRERTLTRKARELLIALILEQNHSKQEILEAYLNIIYFGQQGSIAIHGVGLAARYYFGKDIHDLGLAESAMLAGLIRAPSKYSPFRHPEAARERRNFILSQMLKQRVITDPEYQSAISSPLGLRTPFDRIRSARYFMDYIHTELVKHYDQQTLVDGGLSIYTTLDLHMQELAELTIRKRLRKLELGSAQLKAIQSPLQGAMVVLEPRTGQILVLIGGRDYIQSPFNRTLARRQSGSIFKPVVILAALARRSSGDPPFTLASVLEDKPFHINLPNKTWMPMNYDKGFRGDVTLRDALERSLNVPMVQIGAEIGYSQIISTARRMGITSPLEPVPSLPIGAFEVTMVEMARAYAVLASGGIRAPLRSILQIIEPDGTRRLLSQAAPYRVFSPAETYLVTSALQGSIDRGTSTYLRDLGYYGSAAGKTGSTNRFRDAWFFGYTPEIVIGTWVGFDLARGLGITASEAALPIGADFMIDVLGPNGAARFSTPPGLERARVAIRKDKQCLHLSELFLTGTVPPRDCPDDSIPSEPRPVIQQVEGPSLPVP